MKVALVHDWLTGMRGGERCLEVFLSMYPDADIFTLFHIPGATSPGIDARVFKSSFIQNIPRADRFYRHLLPLFPLAVSKFDLSGYDLVISTSHAAAKNVRIPNPNTVHISYCFTPMRYIWDQAPHYFGRATPLLWPILKALRAWDLKGADSVTSFVAISEFIAARIRCFYGRTSRVVYPPVDTSWITKNCPAGSKWQRGEAFLYAGALVPYKRPELVVEAFNQLGEPLWILGTGPLEKKLKKMAKANIQFIGHSPDIELAEYYRYCRALVFPGTEDFGMIPVECMAAGRPVIGLFEGGLKETINGARPWMKKNGVENRTAVDGCDSQHTGVFFENNDSPLESFISSIKYFMDHEEDFTPEACRLQASRFGMEPFFVGWQSAVDAALNGKNLQSKVPPAKPINGLRVGNA